MFFMGCLENEFQIPPSPFAKGGEGGCGLKRFEESFGEIGFIINYFLPKIPIPFLGHRSISPHPATPSMTKRGTWLEVKTEILGQASVIKY